MTREVLSPLVASRLAHEIRSPLGILSGTLSQLARDEGLSKASAQLLTLARRSCVRMERLSRRLDTFAADGPSDRSPVQLDVLGSWVERARNEAGRSGVEVEMSPLPALTIPGRSAAALEVATDEVVHNAVRHARARVEVRTEALEGTLRVTVSDDGRGMPPELVDTPPSVRADARGGLGLGLLVAHDFLTAAEGTLRILPDRVEIEVPDR